MGRTSRTLWGYLRLAPLLFVLVACTPQTRSFVAQTLQQIFFPTACASDCLKSSGPLAVSLPPSTFSQTPPSTGLPSESLALSFALVLLALVFGLEFRALARWANPASPRAPPSRAFAVSV